MKPLLIIGSQAVLFILLVYLTFYLSYELEGWTATPTIFLCFVLCVIVGCTTTFTTISYLPGPKQ